MIGSLIQRNQERACVVIWSQLINRVFLAEETALERYYYAEAHLRKSSRRADTPLEPVGDRLHFPYPSAFSKEAMRIETM